MAGPAPAREGTAAGGGQTSARRPPGLDCPAPAFREAAPFLLSRLSFLASQAGPVIKVKIPKDRDGRPKQFAFVNFKHEESVPYGLSLLNGIKLYGRPIKIQFRSGTRQKKH